MFRFAKNTGKITIKKIVLITLGSISLGLGILGIFLPVLPTTPFLLLTAWLWAKSSPTLYYWLNHNKYFGKYLKRYREGLGIPLKTKIITLIALWVSISISIFFFISFLWLKILLFMIASAVTYHLLSRPTYIEKKNDIKNK